MTAGVIALIVLAVFVFIVAAAGIRIVPQARAGIVLTKLDGTAKGGIALAIANELGIPVKLIGIGEQLEDLRPFDADDFARALLTP